MTTLCDEGLTLFSQIVLMVIGGIFFALIGFITVYTRRRKKKIIYTIFAILEVIIFLFNGLVLSEYIKTKIKVNELIEYATHEGGKKLETYTNSNVPFYNEFLSKYDDLILVNDIVKKGKTVTVKFEEDGKPYTAENIDKVATLVVDALECGRTTTVETYYKGIKFRMPFAPTQHINKPKCLTNYLHSNHKDCMSFTNEPLKNFKEGVYINPRNCRLYEVRSNMDDLIITNLE